MSSGPPFHGPPPSYPPPPGQAHPAPGSTPNFPPSSGTPPYSTGWSPHPPGWSPRRRSKIGLYLLIFVAGWIFVSIIVVILFVTGVIGDGRSNTSSPAGSSIPSVAGTGTGGADGWLAGRWCSGSDSVTFDAAARRYATSIGQRGTYSMTGSQMTMTAPDGASNSFTVTRLGSNEMTFSSTAQGTETLRRC